MTDKSHNLLIFTEAGLIVHGSVPHVSIFVTLRFAIGDCS